MKIELLYFDGCPSWQNGLENLKSALLAENLEVEIQLICIQSDEDAAKEKFLGSPSFRINDRDLWPEERQNYYLGCRVYNTNSGMRGYPGVDMLRKKLLELKLSKI